MLFRSVPFLAKIFCLRIESSIQVQMRAQASWIYFAAILVSREKMHGYRTFVCLSRRFHQMAAPARAVSGYRFHCHVQRKELKSGGIIIFAVTLSI